MTPDDDKLGLAGITGGVILRLLIEGFVSFESLFESLLLGDDLIKGFTLGLIIPPVRRRLFRSILPFFLADSIVNMVYKYLYILSNVRTL